MTEPVNKESDPVNKEDVHVELITKEPMASISHQSVVAKIKDPRKIEAGKKLAAYNKKAKKSKAELKENTAATWPDSESQSGDTGFNISLTTVVAIIGLGLTAVDLYLRHKKNNEKGVKDYKMMIIDDKPPVGNKLEKTSVGNGVENEKNNKKGVKTVRFSQGME